MRDHDRIVSSIGEATPVPKHPAAVPLAAPSALAAAEGGWTARAALQRSLSSVDYRKTVGVGPPPAAVADDRARSPVDALEASVGYRFFATRGLYVAAELGGALYSRDSAGFLRGAGYGERDVWPGAWTLEKRRALSLAARLGYVPGTLGEGGAFYLFAETGRLRVDMDAKHVNPATRRAGSPDGGAPRAGKCRTRRQSIRAGVGCGIVLPTPRPAASCEEPGADRTRASTACPTRYRARARA